MTRRLLCVAALLCWTPSGAFATAGTPAAPTPTSDDEAAIAEELARTLPPPTPTRRTVGAGAGPSARGLSSLLNPAISANVLLLGGASSREGISGVEDAEPQGATHDAHAHEDGGHLPGGLSLQEVELRLSGVVDPYLRADLTFAAHGEEMHFEEAFFTTLDLPRVTVRGGRMYASFGRHNALHTHAFPLLGAPLPWRTLLGIDGLNDVGLSAAVLLPLPFFAELVIEVFDGQMTPFAPAEPEPGSEPIDVREFWDLAWIGRLRTVFDVGETSAIEFGGTWLGGRGAGGGVTQVMGADVTFKRPPAGRLRGGAWHAGVEVLAVHRPDDHEPWQGGAFAAAGHQLSGRWWLRARGALLGLPGLQDAGALRAEALLAFVPTETSAFRLQYAFERPEPGTVNAIHELFLQAVFSIGPHPAHPW